MVRPHSTVFVSTNVYTHKKNKAKKSKQPFLLQFAFVNH